MTTESGPNIWRNMFTQPTVGKNGVLFANVTHGMPCLAVEKLRPGLSIAADLMIGAFHTDGAVHTL